MCHVAILVVFLIGCRREAKLNEQPPRKENFIIVTADLTPGQTTTVSAPPNTVYIHLRVHATGSKRYRVTVRDAQGAVIATKSSLEFEISRPQQGTYRVEVEGDGKPAGVAILEIK